VVNSKLVELEFIINLKVLFTCSFVKKEQSWRGCRTSSVLCTLLKRNSSKTLSITSRLR